MITSIILVCVTILSYLFWKDNYGKGRIPPGPIKFPIIGNIPQILFSGKILPYIAFDQMSKKYGPIMSLKLGQVKFVVLTSIEDMNELLTKDGCDDRSTTNPMTSERAFGRSEAYGVVTCNGQIWKTMRKFTIHNLRQFGFGKKDSMESVMLTEIKSLIDLTESTSELKGELIVDQFFSMSLLNVLWSMVAGKRYQIDDPRLHHLLQLSSEAFRLSTFVGDASVAFPFTRKYFPQFTNVSKWKAIHDEFHQFCRDIYQEHKSRENFSDEPESFVDVFITKMEEEKELPKEERLFTEEQFIVTIMDLFQVGTETLNGTLCYGLLLMILYPQVQKKVQAEIQATVGDDINADLELAHKQKMPYTQATLQEIQRIGNIVPIIPPRQVTKDFEYKGYTFKKGTSIFPNLYSTVRNEADFPDPEIFRPERFLSPEGKLINTQKHAPFGFGKRFCLGETLATPALFLYFTMMLKHFEFSNAPSQELSIEPRPSFTATPQPFKMMVKVRH